MRQLFCQTNLEHGKGSKKSKSDDNVEVALGAFDGVCYLCLKKGHKAHFCLTKNNAENGENKGKTYCALTAESKDINHMTVGRRRRISTSNQVISKQKLTSKAVNKVM